MLLLYILFDCDKHYILCWEVFIDNYFKKLYLNYIISFLTEVRYNNKSDSSISSLASAKKAGFR